MKTLPTNILPILQSFSQIFSNKRSWVLASFLFAPLVLVKGGRTVCRLLRFLGLKGEKEFDKYHKLLNRANWDMLKGSKILLTKILGNLPSNSTTYIAIDEHLERRRGSKIKALGCYRDAVLSTKRRKVKSFGLKWMNVAVLKKFSWSCNVFALPFLMVLTRSNEADRRDNRRHKTTTDWMCQIAKQLKRWFGERRVVIITDGGLNSIELALTCLKNKQHWITRLPCNARLYDFPPEKSPGRGRPRVRGTQLESPKAMLARRDLPWKTIKVRWYGGRLKQVEYVTFTCVRYVDGFPPAPVRITLLKDPSGENESIALMGVSHDMSLDALEMIENFVCRWNLEVTFRESREHLGIETQRQWSDKAIARTTPILFSVYSLVLLIADHLNVTIPITPDKTAWYPKSNVTFSDALTAVRKYLWQNNNFNFLPKEDTLKKNSTTTYWDILWNHLAECA
jgi:DDE superfamily endonuclease